MHKTLLVPVLMYDIKTKLWKEKERSRFRAVQTDNLRGLLGIRRTNRVPNARIRELCRAKNGLDDMIDEGVLWWFGHVKMEINRFQESLCRRVCWEGRGRDGLIP